MHIVVESELSTQHAAETHLNALDVTHKDVLDAVCKRGLKVELENKGQQQRAGRWASALWAKFGCWLLLLQQLFSTNTNESAPSTRKHTSCCSSAILWEKACVMLAKELLEALAKSGSSSSCGEGTLFRAVAMASCCA